MIKKRNASLKGLLVSLQNVASNDKLYLSFISFFFADYDPDDCREQDINVLHKTSLNLFKLLQKKVEGTPVINVLNISEKKDSSFIEIVSEDMPFIVDSLTNHIARKGIKIKRIINSVIPVKKSFNKIKSFSDESEHKLKSVI